MTAPLARPPAPGGVDEIVVALVGRPNSGKTSLMMHLTGTVQRPVNFAGTSVERVEGVVEVEGRRVRFVDLPGIASLEPLSRDEEVALEFLRAGADPTAARPPDVICAVLDASKLSVELQLLRDLAGLGRPLAVALNKTDVARAEGRPVHAVALAEILQIPVLETDGLRGKGVGWLRQALVDAVARGAPPVFEESIDGIVERVQVQPPADTTLTDRIDAVLLHRWIGLPILLLVMLGMFQLVFSGAEPFIAGIESAQAWVAAWIESWLAPGALRSFLVDGLINGVGSVLVFLPQIALLVALVTVLEASGYMARAAFLLDRLLSRVGLSGRSFVPLTTSFACAIPGILASRIIGDERDRIATIVVAPLMSCSARLPVYVVLVGAFFPVAWAGVVLFGLYALGIATAALVAWALRRTVLRGGASPLLMEMPVYQRPSWRVVWSQVRQACRSFLVLAGTVILASAVVIWALSYYPRPAEIHARFKVERTQVAVLAPQVQENALDRIDAAERAAYFQQSYLARTGQWIQPVFAPAGFDWRTSVGVLAAFPARELILPTLGILFSLGEIDAGEYDLDELATAPDRPGALRERLRTARRADGSAAFDGLIALAIMVFFALCSQCAATLGAIRRETRSWRWPAFTFAYMTAAAWLAAVAVYQIGTALGWGS